MKRIDKVKDILGGVYSEGFEDGQKAMIRAFNNYGLINEQMAELMYGLIYGETDLDAYYDEKREMAVVAQVCDALEYK